MDENELLQIIEKAVREKAALLDLSGKGITSLPAEIGKLTNLTALLLHNNQLKSIPADLGKLTKLDTLFLDGNEALTSPPPRWSSREPRRY